MAVPPSSRAGRPGSASAPPRRPRATSSVWDYLSRLHREADPAFHPAQALWSLSHLAYAALQPGRS
jgi:hypothetical protein